MKNERGASLVLVLLISLLFVTLGLTILSVSLQGAKRTSIRENDVITSQDAILEMTKVLADFQSELKDVSIKKRNELTSGNYESSVQQIITDINDKFFKRYNSTDKSLKPILYVTDETKEYIKDSDGNLVQDETYKRKFYTRVYLFKIDFYGELNKTTPILKKSISRKVYLSPTPSFLQYAVGAKNDLILNGASDLIGNIYGSNVKVLNQANYMDASTPLNTQSHADTPYPRIRGSLVIQKQLILSKRKQALQDVSYSSIQLSLVNQSLFDQYFYDKAPIIKKPDETFVNMDFEQTLFDKLNFVLAPIQLNESQQLTPSLGNEIINKMIDLSDPTKIQENVSKKNNDLSTKYYIIDKNINPGDIASTIPAEKKVIVMSDLEGKNTNAPFIIKDDLHLNKDQWLIVNGDLEIYNKYISSNNSASDPSTDIQGNIIVLGNVSIHGFNDSTGTEQDEIKFDTTMYVLGTSNIYSTNITGLNDKQLVLLSKGNLEVNRTNEFSTISDTVIPLKAFLYTDGMATLYGVGSAISINGGVFSNDTLTINAIRQNTVQTSSPNTLIIDTESKQINQSSRFSVIYDKSILLSQLEALPTVDSIRLIKDHYIILK